MKMPQYSEMTIAQAAYDAACKSAKLRCDWDALSKDARNMWVAASEAAIKADKKATREWKKYVESVHGKR